MEPLTLAAVSGAVLTEGVKFLYAQATELIKYWRARRDGQQVEVVSAPVPGEVLAGEIGSMSVDDAALERLQGEVRDLRSRLLDYVEGSEPISTADTRLLQQADALRTVLEAVYQQRFTLAGEQREASGPLIHGRIEVDEVAGYAAAVRAETIRLGSGTVQGEARAGRVGKDGEIVGLDIGVAETE